MEMISPTELAAMLDISTATLAKLSRDGWLPQPIRLNRRLVRYRLEPVLERIRQLEDQVTVPQDDDE